MLKEKLPEIVEQIKTYFNQTVVYNRVLIDIIEGSLLPYVEKVMKKELSEKAFERARGRIPPLNVLLKVIDKLTHIYSEPVSRTTTDPIDKDLLSYYEKSYNINTQLDEANRLYNTNKYVAVEPYLEENSPRLRVLPANKFMVYSDDKLNPTNMTVFIKLMELPKNNYQSLDEQREKTIFYLYSKEEFLIIDGRGTIRYDLMAQAGIEDGINVYGAIPAIYIAQSKIDLIPMKDTDTFNMSVLAPLIFSDLNYCIQFLSHSVFYGIDVDVANLEMNPDSFWEVTSKPGENSKPQIGTIKPEVDITESIENIKEQMAIWFDTKGLKSNTNAQGSVDTLSGIAKLIDSADTTEARKRQALVFRQSEDQLWDLTSKMHEVWALNGQIEERRLFSKDFEVAIEYSDLKPYADIKTKLEEIKLKLDNKLISKKKALKEANPDLTEEQLIELMLEIEEESFQKKVVSIVGDKNMDKNMEEVNAE
jgi:hypothetical protein